MLSKGAAEIHFVKEDHIDTPKQRSKIRKLVASIQVISLFLSNHYSSVLKSLNQVGLTASCKSFSKVIVLLDYSQFL